MLQRAFLVALLATQLLACGDSTSGELVTDCANPSTVEPGAACRGMFSCSGPCSDNFPVGGQCEFGCDQFECVEGVIEQTGSRYLDTCSNADAGGGSADGGV